MTAPDAAALTADIELLHRCAGPAGGKLILASFGQDPHTGENLSPRIEAFSIGDTARMSMRALTLASEANRNVYAAQATMRIDLQSGRKGGEDDIEAVFGLVADFDAREDPRAHEWSVRLPIPPTVVIETSSLPEPSFQCRYLFSEPVSRAVAKSLARALQVVSKCDTCTADLSHVWRIAGGLNWPNKLKFEKHGRPLGGQLVRVLVPFSADRLVTSEQLAAALGAVADEPASATPRPTPESPAVARLTVTLDELDTWNVPAAVKAVIQLGRDPDRPKKQDNSRSAWLFHVVRALKRQSVPAEAILSVITNPAFKISESVLDKGRRANEYAERQIARADAEASDEVLESFNREHAVVENYGSRTVVFSFDSKGRFFHRTFEDFKRSYDHRKVLVARGGKTVPAGQGSASIENSHRRQFKGVVFLPGLEADDGILNLYRGPSIEPVPGECRAFLAFVTEIICGCNTELTDWLLDFVAHIFQKPWEPPEVCIVLRGPQGVGKNFFVEAIGSIVADYFMTVSNPKHLVGGFNRHLMDKLVVFADEAFYGNERRYAGILKALVTQREMTVEPKGVDVFMAKKYFRLFMASNEDFVVPADVDDRRFLVLDVSNSHAKDHTYFGELHREWSDAGREAFYDLMLKRDISKFNHRARPETAGLTEQKIESLVGTERLVFEMLANGEAPIPVQQEDVNFIATEVLADHFARRGIRANARAIAIELAAIAMHDESKRESVYGRQMRGFWVPPLRECRLAWARAKRLEIRWPDDDWEWINTFQNEVL